MKRLLILLAILAPAIVTGQQTVRFKNVKIDSNLTISYMPTDTSTLILVLGADGKVRANRSAGMGSFEGADLDSLAWYRNAGATWQRYPSDSVVINRKITSKGNDLWMYSRSLTTPATSNAEVYLSGTSGSMYIKAMKHNPPFSNAYAMYTLSPANAASGWNFSTDEFGTYAYQLDEYGFYPTDYTTAGDYNQYIGTPANKWRRGYFERLIADTIPSGALYPPLASSQWTTEADGIYYAGGNVGIGTTNPSATDSTAQVTGSMNVSRGAKFGYDVTVNGLTVGKGNRGVATNTAMGAAALSSNTTGFWNTSVGYNAALSNTTGNYNTAIGFYAGRLNANGNGNTSIGCGSQQSNTSGSDNTAIGYNALYSNTTANGNVAVGRSSLYSNNGNSNTSVGCESSNENISGGENVSVGRYSLSKNTSGNSNTAIGFRSLYESLGKNNTSVGWNSTRQTTTGFSNTAVGISSLYSNTTGYRNIALGDSAGYAYTTLSNRMYLGARDTVGTTGGIYFDRTPAKRWGKWMGTMKITNIPADGSPDSVLTVVDGLVKRAAFPSGTTYTATSPMSVAGNDVHILSDTLTEWYDKQNKGALAHTWGDHSTQGYLTAESDPVWISDSTNYLHKSDTSLVLLTQPRAASTYQPKGSYIATSDAEITMPNLQQAPLTGLTNYPKFLNYDPVTGEIGWNSMGITYANNNKDTNALIIWVGDSMLRGGNCSQPPTSASVTYPTINGCVPDTVNISVGGIKACNADSAYMGLLASNYRRNASNIMVVWLGINDLKTVTAGSAYQCIEGFCTKWKNLGYRIIVATLPSSNVGDAKRNAFNALIRANWTRFADRLADLAAESHIGPDGAYSNATYFCDGLHLTTTGNAYAADVLESAVQDLVVNQRDQYAANLVADTVFAYIPGYQQSIDTANLVNFGDTLVKIATKKNITDAVANGNTAYSWGDHADAGYIVDPVGNEGSFIVKSTGGTYVTTDGGVKWDEYNGLFGIGTTSPKAKLHVDRATQGYAFAFTNSMRNKNQSTDAQLTDTSVFYMYFYPSGKSFWALKSHSGIGRMYGDTLGKFYVLDTTQIQYEFVPSGQSKSLFFSSSGSYNIVSYSGSPTIMGQKAGGTRSTPTKATAGSRLLDLQGSGYQQTTGAFTASKARITLVAIEDFTSTANGTAIDFATTASGSTTQSVQMRLNSTGLGLGTTSPSEKVDVAGNIKTTGEVKYAASPTSDHTCSGDVITLTAATTQAIGDVVYIASTGKATLCDADAIATCPYALAVCADASISADASGDYMTKGVIRDDTWNWTVGGLIYVAAPGGSAASGSTLTQTAPSASNNVIIPVGVALSADIMYFWGNLNTVEKQ